MKYNAAFYRLLLMAMWVTSLACADGLSTAFADIEVGNVVLGRPQKVLDQSGRSLTIKNLGGSPVRVVIDVLVPQPTQLRPGAQPIPDVRWLEARPNVLNLEAHEEKECEITLRVPRKKTFRSQYYQAMIWSHGVPSDSPGMTISAGLLSRVRFRTKE